MKTSNKLLITLGLLMIIIPILVTAVTVKLYYQPAPPSTYLERQQINNESFDQKSPGRVAMGIKAPFKKVNFSDARNLFISLHLTKSTSTGIKIPSYAKDRITFEVTNGVLNISLLENFSTGRPLDIVIYSPTFETLDISNAFLFELTTELIDSLTVNANNTGNLTLGGAITNFNNKGEVISSINDTKINNLHISLNKSTFQVNDHSFENLSINCLKNSKIEINGDDSIGDKYHIKNLKLNTADTADVILKNMKIDVITGKISDDTKIQMPNKYLKQLLIK